MGSRVLSNIKRRQLVICSDCMSSYITTCICDVTNEPVRWTLKFATVYPFKHYLTIIARLWLCSTSFRLPSSWVSRARLSWVCKLFALRSSSPRRAWSLDISSSRRSQASFDLSEEFCRIINSITTKWLERSPLALIVLGSRRLVFGIFSKIFLFTQQGMAVRMRSGTLTQLHCCQYELAPKLFIRSLAMEHLPLLQIFPIFSPGSRYFVLL